MVETLKDPEDSLYERDFYAWTQEQAAKLRARAHDDIDWENAAEEIETLGRSDKREVRNRLIIILAHLLKWQFQPGKRSSGWRGSLAESRDQIRELIDESASLRPYPASVRDGAYRIARLKAAGESELPEPHFPETCPYSVEQILDLDFLPEADSEDYQHRLP